MRSAEHGGGGKQGSNKIEHIHSQDTAPHDAVKSEGWRMGMWVAERTTPAGVAGGARAHMGRTPGMNCVISLTRMLNVWSNSRRIAAHGVVAIKLHMAPPC